MDSPRADDITVPEHLNAVTFPLWKALVLPWSMVLFFFGPIFNGNVPLNADWLAACAVPWRSGPPVDMYNPEMDDPILEYYPLAVSAGGILRKDRIPLWNPALGLGLPQLADFHSLPLDPLFFFIFRLISDNAFAWGFFLMAQFLVLSAVTAGFLRERGLSVFPVSWGTTALVFSGPCVTRCELRTFTGTLIGMMLAFWGIERFKNKPIHLNLTWIAFGLALTVVSGHIQYSVYAWIIIIVYLGYEILGRECEKGRIVSSAGVILFVGIAAMLMSAFQWLPESELLVRSFRGETGRYFSSFRFGIMPWISLLSPDFLGHPSSRSYFGLFIYYKSYVNLPVIYMGVSSLMFLLLAYMKNNPGRRFFGVMMGGILIALTTMGLKPVRVGLYRLCPDIFDLDPARLAMIVVAAGAVLVAEGSEYWFQSDTRRDARRAVMFIGGLIIGIFCLISTVFFFLRNYLFSLAADNSFLIYCLKVQEKHGLLLGDRDVWKPMMFLVIMMFIVRIGLSMRAKGILVSLVMAADLLPFTIRYNPMVPVKWLDLPPSFSDVQPETGFKTGRIIGIDSFNARRIEGESLPPDTALLTGMFNLRAYISTPPHRYQTFMSCNYIGRYYDRRFPLKNKKILDISGVRWIVCAPDLELKGVSLLKHHPRFRLYENSGAYPKIWFVERVVAERGRRIWEAFGEKGPDLRRIALAEPPMQDLAFNPSSEDRVTLERANETSLVFTGWTRLGRFAVMNELFFPGWKLSINERNEEIIPVDGVFRGFFVPPGQFKAVMEYRPVSFLLGLFASMTAAAACAGIAVFGGRKRLC